MLTFKPISKDDIYLLSEYFKDCSYGICEYSIGINFMYKDFLNVTYAKTDKALIICKYYNDDIVFDYPVAKELCYEEQALSELENYCMKNNIDLKISNVPEDKLKQLLLWYPYINITHLRFNEDYIYNADDMNSFKGRRYSGQRNHINKFYSLYPNAEFKMLTSADENLINRFWQEYESEFRKYENKSAAFELEATKMIFKFLNYPCFFAGAIINEGKIIALSLGEKCGEYLIIHVEKALRKYEGSYPVIVRKFAKKFGSECRWINREDDASDEGLRISKLQYKPCKMSKKYYLTANRCFLEHITKVPVLKTERLILSEITENDVEDYNRLVLDKKRNKFWGYDDEKFVSKPIHKLSFFDVARNDFENKEAVNFAVRLNGEFIGEAVIYNFDFRGTAEIGCRILKEYENNSYGKEAFCRVARWGLYDLKLNRVTAKCYHENHSSYAMLSYCMRKIGEDDEFFYFEKQV